MRKFEELMYQMSDVFEQPFQSEVERDKAVVDFVKSKLTPAEIQDFKNWLPDCNKTAPLILYSDPHRREFAIDKNNVDHWLIILKFIQDGAIIHRVEPCSHPVHISVTTLIEIENPKI